MVCRYASDGTVSVSRVVLGDTVDSTHVLYWVTPLGDTVDSTHVLYWVTPLGDTVDSTHILGMLPCPYKRAHAIDVTEAHQGPDDI
jgi:hypothetical protein